MFKVKQIREAIFYYIISLDIYFFNDRLNSLILRNHYQRKAGIYEKGITERFY